MMRPYRIRVEFPNRTYTDTTIEAGTLIGARDRFARNDPSGELAPYDWRGQVVFVQGAQPAEEMRLAWTNDSR